MGSQRRGDYLWGALFVIPSLLLILALKYYPLVLGVLNSLRQWTGTESHYVGLANFARMLGDPMVHQTFLNALKIAVTLPIWIFLPMVVSFLVYQRTPGWQFFRVVFFLPYTISPVIVGLIWRQILHVQGPVNALLGALSRGSTLAQLAGRQEPRAVDDRRGGAVEHLRVRHRHLPRRAWPRSTRRSSTRRQSTGRASGRGCDASSSPC